MEFLVEIVLEVLGQLLVDWGTGSIKEARGRENRNPALATIGYLVLGGALGAASLLVWPERLIRPAPVPGLGLVIGPLLSGAAMHFWGDFRRAQGHSPTNLATFYGGAAFAFGMALVRFIWAA